MALTKSIGNAVVTSQSCTAGATVTSSGASLLTAYASRYYGTITNGATGPTLPCAAIVDASTDAGTTWVEYSRFTAGIANNGVYTFNLPVDITVGHARLRFTGNTAQTVTVIGFRDTVTKL